MNSTIRIIVRAKGKKEEIISLEVTAAEAERIDPVKTVPSRVYFSHGDTRYHVNGFNYFHSRKLYVAILSG